MTLALTGLLPQTAVALLLACAVLAGLSRMMRSRSARQLLRYERIVTVSCFVLVLLLCLVPIPGMQQNIASIARVITGDLSLVTISMLLIFAWHGTKQRSSTGQRTTAAVRTVLQKDSVRLQILVSAAAIVLYPTALGVTAIDFYSQGYYPDIMIPVLMALFGLAIYRGWYLLGGLIAIAFAGYFSGLLDSDNLWDYLMDPVLAIYCLAKLCLTRFRAVKQIRPNARSIRQAILFGITSFLLSTILLSQHNPDALYFF